MESDDSNLTQPLSPFDMKARENESNDNAVAGDSESRDVIDSQDVASSSPLRNISAHDSHDNTSISQEVPVKDDNDNATPISEAIITQETALNEEKSTTPSEEPENK